MIKNLFIPKLGMTMEKGTISEWVANDGEQVQKEQVLLILETEKVAHELVAPMAGFLAVFSKAGEEYLCGTVVGAIVETKSEYESIKKDPGKFLAGQNSGSVELEQGAEQKTAAAEADASSGPSEAEKLDPSVKIKISPVAKYLAKDQNIDISALKGSGPEGRIIKSDIVSAIAAKQQKASDIAFRKPKVATVQPSSAESVAGKRVLESISFKGMRKNIADNLHHSLASTARVSVMFEFDVTELIKFRNYYAGKADTLGFKVTYTDLFMLMVAKSIKAVPIMNSSIVGEEIKIWKDVNIGFAVAVKKSETESGLVVPVIKNVEKMSLGEIAEHRISLMNKARTNSLAMDDFQGGTFTLTNTGTLSTTGWQVQTPIMNPGEAAILGCGAIVDRPVVKNGEIVIGSIMPMSLSFDHQIMDGTPPGRFIDKMAQMIADPQLIVI